MIRVPGGYKVTIDDLEKCGFVYKRLSKHWYLIRLYSIKADTKWKRFWSHVVVLWWFRREDELKRRMDDQLFVSYLVQGEKHIINHAECGCS